MTGSRDNPAKCILPKRSRTRAPRVRTGCKTCKIRHLKCDEAKPICHRCHQDRVKCDGYESRPRVTTRPEGHSEHNSIQLVYTAQSLSTNGDTQDLYLRHTIQYTIGDLAESTTCTSFWADFLPHSFSQIEATRYALIALGAAHMNFLDQKRNIISNSQHERSVILNYNLAIRHLQPLMSKATVECIEAALVCCVLFICIENVRGRYVESIRHLQSGAQLLASLLTPGASYLTTTLRKARLPAVLHQAISSNRHGKSRIGYIANLFSRLSLETHILIDDNVIPFTTVSHPSPYLDDDVSRLFCTPFTTLDAAREDLHLFEIAHDVFYQQTYDNIKSRSLSAQSQLLQQSDCLLTLFDENDKAMYRRIYRRFWQWSVRFDGYMAASLTYPRSSKESSEVSKIRLLQKTWMAILDKEPWTFNGPKDPAFGVLEGFLPEVELIIELRGLSSRPLFTFGADVLPYVTLAGCLTEDLGLLQRIITILKLLDRREGMWDSKDLAEIFEASIIARTQFGACIQGSAGGVLGMAKALSDMKIPCISANNSVVLLARNFQS